MDDSFSIIREKLKPEEAEKLLEKISENKSLYTLILNIEPARKADFNIINMKKYKLEVEPAQSLGPITSQEVKVSFLDSNAQFEATGQLKNKKNSQFQLDLYKDIYRIQRRDNFRVRIPSMWNTKIIVNPADTSKEKFNGTLFDLSLRGCFFIPDKDAPSLNSGDEFQAEIEIDEFNPLSVKAIVHRARYLEGQYGYGCEFLEVEGQGSAILNKITLKASRLNRSYTD